MKKIINFNDTWDSLDHWLFLFDIGANFSANMLGLGVASLASKREMHQFPINIESLLSLNQNMFYAN